MKGAGRWETAYSIVLVLCSFVEMMRQKLHTTQTLVQQKVDVIKVLDILVTIKAALKKKDTLSGETTINSSALF